MDTGAYANARSYGHTDTCTYTNAHSCSNSYSNAHIDADSHFRSNGHGNADTRAYTDADTFSTAIIRRTEEPVGPDRQTRAADLLNYVFL